MKITQLVTRRQRRGAEVVAADLSESLVTLGHKVEYVGLGAPPFSGAIAPTGTMTRDLSDGPNRRLDIRLARKLSNYLKKTRPDVIQANGGYSMKYLAFANRFNQIQSPIVYCNIGLSSDWLRWPGQRFFNRWVLKHATLTAAVSNASRDDLIKTYNLPPESIRVIRRGVPTRQLDRQESRRKLCEELAIPIHANILLHVGSFAPEKNHVGLCRIFEKVVKQVPSSQLVLVGDGPLRTEIEKNNQVGNVHFLGVRNDVLTLMAAANLLLLPSLTEGIPGVILEAGSQGTPTIAYDVGGVSEAIENRVSGSIVDLNDEFNFAAAIIESTTNSDLHSALSNACRNLICEQFDLGQSVAAFEEIYNTALAESCHA